VGDRYVVEEMMRAGYVLGGEQSGHIVFLDLNTTGDGPLTALQVLYLMKKTGRTISELVKDIELYPQVLLNVPLARHSDISAIPEIVHVIEESTRKLGTKGRILVRPSGTEPKIRVMVECSHADMAQTTAQEIADVIHRKVGIREP
jgi:phosphoglucosamine mutase